MKNPKLPLVVFAAFITSFTVVAQSLDPVTKPATPLVELLEEAPVKPTEQIVDVDLASVVTDEKISTPDYAGDGVYGANSDYLLSPHGAAKKIYVSNVSQLDTALKSANPGDAVIVESGTYNLAGTVSLTRSGTAEAPIYLLSAEKDGVIFKGSRGWSFNGNHWVISGFIFQSWKERLGLNGNNIRFSGNKFRQSGAPLTIFGSDSEISENIWTGSTSLSIIAAQSGITCTKCKFPKGTHIHHNTFKDIPRLKTNGGEAMMLGYGYEPIPPSYDDGLELLIENNLFENAKGDREVISFKSSNNTVRNNCFLNNGWGGLVIRMGNDNVITGNQFIGLETTGVRISGSGNVLRKNYFEGKKNNTYSAITFHNRSLNSDAKYDPWGIYKYDAADNNIIEDNQFYSFKNLIRDYSFVGESLKHSEGTEVSGNEFYITSSSLYNLQAGRSKAEILDAHTIVDNEMLSEAPTSRSSCR